MQINRPKRPTILRHRPFQILSIPNDFSFFFKADHLLLSFFWFFTSPFLLNLLEKQHANFCKNPYRQNHHT